MKTRPNFLAITAMLLVSIAAAARSQFALDGFDSNAKGTVCFVTVLPDGKVLRGGDSTALAPNGGAAAIPLTVTTTADNGAGSLRDLLGMATDGETIQFDPALNGQTITLTSGELLIDKNITINGPGPNTLEVSRAVNAPNFSIFHVMPGHTAIIGGLTISEGNGSGIFNDAATLTINNCTVSGNTNDVRGGGIYNRGGVLTIADSTVSHNHIRLTFPSTNGSGGGISSDGTLTILRSTIADNGAVYGAGINGTGTITVTDSTISGNNASQGGGISAYDTSSIAVSVMITHSTISGNVAANVGGGIDIESSGVVLEIGDTILSSAMGVNIFNGGGGTVTSRGYNLSSDNGGGFLTATGDQINTDPMVGPLQNNGGPTMTHALLKGSPAIDAGDPNFIPPPFTDQRGYDRIFNGRIDIGALEAQPVATPSPTTTPGPATLGNISTRLQVGTSDRGMIAGFIVQGSAPKRVLIRAAGPSLANFGVPNPLPNPEVELHDTTGTIGRNDDWQTTQIGGVITSDQVAEIQSWGLAPSDPAESAIIATLPPGSYTAIVQGVNGGTGVGIVEVYDLNAASGSLLANISTRGFVQTEDNVMIGGFIIVTQPTRVIIRAIGPSLTQFGVPDALTNPQLELHDASSTIAQNDDWQTTQIGGIITSNQMAEIQNSELAPTNAAESAIIATLQPGNYTAIVRGVNNTTGNALVEVYQLSGTATPTPSPTATATPTPTPIVTPSPTATATPTSTPIVTPSPTATATATSTPIVTPTPSPSATPTPSPSGTPGQTPAAKFGSLSSRAVVGTGDAIVLNAFIIMGPDPRRVIVRGLGPSLPFSSPLADPALDLRASGGTLVATNDNWRSDQEAEIIATGLPPTNDLEAAIVRTLSPGSYTVVLRGVNNGTGHGLSDLYDLSPGASSTLTAVGTRAKSLTGSDILTSGVVMTQGGLGDVLIRVLGPSLANAGISDLLADPTLELRDVNGALLHANNNWQDDPKQAMFIQATGLAPTNPLESAIYTSLQPGTFIVLAPGLNSTTGIGYIQFYNLPHSGPVLQLTP